MHTESLFRRLPDPTSGPARMLTLQVDGRDLEVPADISVAAALLLAGAAAFHSAAVSGKPRAPYCMMGVCFECLVEIDGQPNQQACLVTVREGMRIATLKAPTLAESVRVEVLHG